jgi:hypothetical protein
MASIPLLISQWPPSPQSFVSQSGEQHFIEVFHDSIIA